MLALASFGGSANDRQEIFQPAGPFALEQIAARLGAELVRPDTANLVIHDVADLASAGDGDISIFCDASHAADFAQSHASAIVTSRALSALPHNGCALLLTDNPRGVFAGIGRLFHPASDHGEIHPSAMIGKTARIGAGTRIGAQAVIGDGVEIGTHCEIGPGSVITHALIGDKVRVGYNCSIGQEGFGYLPSARGVEKIAQLGRVVIGDGVEISSNCTIDRGALGDTCVGPGTVIGDLVHIAHNVRIGKMCVIAGQVGIAGSTVLGDHVMMGGQVGIADHLTIGKGAKIAAKSGVIRDIAAGETVAGYPALPSRQWHRQTVALAKLVLKKCRSTE
jgi:UDP-3-O-[3-hydroxymyristoyl] glucosamine N-acyltransferase